MLSSASYVLSAVVGFFLRDLLMRKSTFLGHVFHAGGFISIISLVLTCKIVFSPRT